jgi:hypothetical protein
MNIHKPGQQRKTAGVDYFISGRSADIAADGSNDAAGDPHIDNAKIPARSDNACTAYHPT